MFVWGEGVYKCLCVHLWRLEFNGVFLKGSLPDFWRQSLSLNQELIYFLAWLGNGSPRILLSLCHPALRSQAATQTTTLHGFAMNAGVPNQVHMPVEQWLYPLSQILHPSVFYCLKKKTNKQNKKQNNNNKKPDRKIYHSGPAFPYCSNGAWVPATTFRRACLLVCPPSARAHLLPGSSFLSFPM